MNSSDIDRVLDDVLHKLRKDYQRTKKDYDIEAIHDFRVQMKKLRAFIRLLNMEMPSSQITLNRKLRSFYTHTGNIRNIQLHQNRLAEICKQLELTIPGSYVSLLDDEIAKHKEEAIKDSGHIDLSHISGTLHSQAPFKITAGSLQNYISIKTSSIAGILTMNEMTDDDIHAVRKIIKDIIYSWPFLASYAAVQLPGWLLSEDNRNRLADDTGDFHDLCISMFYLGPFYIDQIPEQEKKIVLLVKWEIDKAKKQLKEKITNDLFLIKKQLLFTDEEG